MKTAEEWKADVYTARFDDDAPPLEMVVLFRAIQADALRAAADVLGELIRSSQQSSDMDDAAAFAVARFDILSLIPEAKP